MLSLICLYYKIWDRGTMCADNGEKTECGKGQWYTGKDGSGIQEKMAVVVTAFSRTT